MSAEPHVYHAVRAVKIEIDQRARDQYVGQIKSFAHDLGFTIRFSQTSPDPNDIVAHLERNDVWMVGGLASGLFGGPEIAYQIAFYSHGNQTMPASSFDPLVDSLRRSLGKVDSAVVTEKALQN